MHPFIKNLINFFFYFLTQVDMQPHANHFQDSEWQHVTHVSEGQEGMKLLFSYYIYIKQENALLSVSVVLTVLA